MLISLAAGIDSSEAQGGSLAIKLNNSEINVESHTHLQAAMVELTSARSKCKDANKVVLELTYQYCELYVLAGCYGRALST